MAVTDGCRQEVIKENYYMLYRLNNIMFLAHTHVCMPIEIKVSLAWVISALI